MVPSTRHYEYTEERRAQSAADLLAIADWKLGAQIELNGHFEIALMRSEMKLLLIAAFVFISLEMSASVVRASPDETADNGLLKLADENTMLSGRRMLVRALTALSAVA